MSDVCFNEKGFYSEENTRGNEVVRSTILFKHFSLTLNWKKIVTMKTIRNKLNIFTVQLHICYILE